VGVPGKLLSTILALQEWDMSTGELTFKEAQKEAREVAVQEKLF
jgi:hypothetical protein